MDIWAERITNANQLGLGKSAITTICDIAFPTMLEGTQTNGLGNLSCRAPISCDIDLKQSGHITSNRP